MRSRLSRLAVAQYYADGEDAFAMRKPLSRAERGRAAKADAQREAAALLAAELRRTLGSGSRVKRADVAEALDAFYGAASGRAALSSACASKLLSNPRGALSMRLSIHRPPWIDGR